MCGFAGIASPRSLRAVAAAELGRMLATVAHRGPDDEACLLRPGIALGFRRLSIVDPERGRQPMGTEDGSLVLACNGEIYNHLSLRDVLTAKGHRFRTGSDSEVVLHAYREWGTGCPAHLRGIFAFALWDETRRVLFLCRDRSGVKPLYVRVHGEELLFASEAKAVLAHPTTPRRLDLLGCFAPAEPDALAEASPFEGVSQLGAGCSAIFDARAELRTTRYWRYAPSAELDGEGAERGLIESLRGTLDEVVAMQLMADVPVGAYVSGGLDSSVIAALARRHASGLATFTSVCAGSEDAWFAHLLSESAKLDDRHFVRFEPETLVGELPRVAWAAEGTLDLAFVARYQLATAARSRGIKVLLSGQGADELLGGYDASYEALAAAASRAANAAALLESGWSSVAAALRNRARSEPADVAAHLKRDHAALSHYLLRFEDRMGMLAGVEVRVPFLDHEIVELCASVPGSLRTRLFGDKRLLREAAAGIVPDGIRMRAKFGFNGQFVPMSQLLARLPGDAPLKALLAPGAIAGSAYFDPRHVRRFAESGNYHALDAVLVVQLLDQLFVKDFDKLSPPTEPIAAPEVAVDASFMPAENVLFRARGGPSEASKPWRSPAVTHVGVLRGMPPATRPVLAAQRHDGRRTLAILPPDLEGRHVVELVLAADGSRTYAVLAAALGVDLGPLLAAGRFAAEQGLLEHGPRTLPA